MTPTWETATREDLAHYYRQRCWGASDDDLHLWAEDAAILIALGQAAETDPESFLWATVQAEAVALEQSLRRRLGVRRTNVYARLFPPETLDAIRRAINLVHLVHNRGVETRTSGATWRGCCPFCQATNPSTLTIWRDSDGAERFRCWRCAAAGDVFTAVMGLDGLPFRQAVEGLAAIADVDLTPPPAVSATVTDQGTRITLGRPA
jgi:hypothetical protein